MMKIPKLHIALRAMWAAVWLSCAAHAGTPLQPGFSDTVFADNLGHTPTAMAWAPDGSNRLFVALKDQGIRIVKDGALLATPFATFPQLYTASECGVLGVCFDPDYTQNHFVYVFVTVSASEQRIVRFTDVNDIGTARANIITGLPTLGTNHDGGGLGFGHDGKLYWAIGDNGNKRGVDGDLATLASKVGRANADGSVPADNPFNDGAGPNNDYIWATGFRNPYSLTFQPGTGKLFLNVVGSTESGQTLPNSGPGYEQVFALSAGEDGGYDDYEGNQPVGARYTTPFTRPYAHPVIQYKTETIAFANHQRNIANVQRSSGAVTVTTTAAHPYRVGQAVRLSGAGAPLDGMLTVFSVPTATTFTALSAGNDASASAGTVSLLAQGSAISGGAFYEGSAFPSAYHGNFFYGDYTGDRIMRAQFDAQNRATSVEYFLTDASSPIDIAVGPDGALYYASIGENSIHRVAWTGTPSDIVVTPGVLPLLEGTTGVCTVRLGSAPAATVNVSVHRVSGDADIAVSGSDDLTFTPQNWNIPQSVKIASAVDADTMDDTATFLVSASGLSPETVQVKATDSSAIAPIVSTRTLAVNEGKSATFTVQLPAPPVRPVTVVVRRIANATKVRVSAGFVMRFNSRNWNIPRTVRVVGVQDVNKADEQATLGITARGYAGRTVAVTVRDNDPSPPVFTSTPIPSAVVGLAYHADVTARGLPAPTFSLTQSPVDMTINPITGALDWTPQSLGDFPITILAANGRNPSASQSFTLSVVADQPPAVQITAPADGTTVSGATAEFFGSASDDYGCAKCEFYIDDVLVFTDTTRENHFHIHGSHNLWDTTLLSNGPHTLKMKVFDDKNQTATSTVQVTVAN